MCSIIGSYNSDKINFLGKLNASRGSLSHSIARFAATGGLLSIERGVGPLPFIEPHNGYILCHQQAPTTQESNTIHPSEYHENLLWHNGIIKSKYLDVMIAQSQNPSTWDTHQLNILITTSGYSGLSDVSGSFSCAWYNNKQLHLFRNAISPMFINEECDISSTRFDGSMSTKENVVYSLNFSNRKFESILEFTNCETPFFFSE
jgi:hypothetical protein